MKNCRSYHWLHLPRPWRVSFWTGFHFFSFFPSVSSSVTQFILCLAIQMCCIISPSLVFSCHARYIFSHLSWTSLTQDGSSTCVQWRPRNATFLQHWVCLLYYESGWLRNWCNALNKLCIIQWLFLIFIFSFPSGIPKPRLVLSASQCVINPNSPINFLQKWVSN